MGETLPGAKLAYKTQGTLNAARDNAILFPHMYSGTSASMEPFIGVGRPLDPQKYFIILPGQFGNGFSSSPNNTPAPFDRARFPKVTIGDDVRAQHRLVTEQFKIDKLQLVLGWSMGAEQTYEWAVRYLRWCCAQLRSVEPPRQRRTTVLRPGSRSQRRPEEQARLSGPSAVKAGLTLHAHVFSVLGVCPAFYKQEAWRIFGSSSLDELMQNFWEAWFLPMLATCSAMGEWRQVSRLLRLRLRRLRFMASPYPDSTVVPFGDWRPAA